MTALEELFTDPDYGKSGYTVSVDECEECGDVRIVFVVKSSEVVVVEGQAVLEPAITNICYPCVMSIEP